MTRVNVLLTSVGRRSYLVRYFQTALKGRGKVVATNSIMDAPAMLAADRAYVVPAATDNSLLVMQTRFAYMPQQAMTLTKNWPSRWGKVKLNMAILSHLLVYPVQW
jgi:hypothetical protein